MVVLGVDIPKGSMASCVADTLFLFFCVHTKCYVDIPILVFLWPCAYRTMAAPSFPACCADTIM